MVMNVTMHQWTGTRERNSYMNVYESLRVALKNATTIRLGDETYHVDCFDTDADE